MELPLFDFIEQTMQSYEYHRPVYEYTERVLSEVFEQIAEEAGSAVVDIHTRVKAQASLREKLLRNKFYLNNTTPDMALSNVHDLVGITLECRFIRNEAELYQSLFRQFHESKEEPFSSYRNNRDVFLNLRMVQPQLQRNGFTIYRLDGYYRFQGQKIPFELQIKSLVHMFWSEIEHEVVYKNQQIGSNVRFMRSMLSSVRDSLDVVDHQLEIIYQEMYEESRNTPIGMNEVGFKRMAAGSINELIIRKMNESVGFSSDFRKDAAILAQYIYLRYFLNGLNNEVRMVEFLEHLSLLAESEIDFKSEIRLEQPYSSKDPFCSILGSYFESVLNKDFEWHAFFVALTAIQEGGNLENLSDFTSVIHTLFIQPHWFATRFSSYEQEEATMARDLLESILARLLVKADSIFIIHEDFMLRVNRWFQDEVEHIENTHMSYAEFMDDEEKIQNSMQRDFEKFVREQKTDIMQIS